VGGGCIHRALKVETDRGAAFLKWSPDASSALFMEEAEGLEALRAVMAGGEEGGFRIPRVLGAGGVDDSGGGWLALEWLEAGPPTADAGERTGRALALLHRPAPGGWGWQGDNHIATLPQANPSSSTWGEFWRDARLYPLLRRAGDRGAFSGAGRGWDRVLEGVEGWLAPVEAEGPVLLHGDLWSGNVFFTRNGEPALVDPAVYRGHREVDLAMMELFGGFPRGTLAAYTRLRPLDEGYVGLRRDLYQLYPLLVHVLLFGRGYEASALERVRRLAALRTP
jgi:fructosamine-3-kinase